jgi:glutathione synthase/RimK-type ligase-like ATP-grasp enzyme
MRESAAREADPSPMIGPARLIRAAFEGSDMAGFASEILARSGGPVVEPGTALDLATILLLMHRSEDALRLQAEVLRSQRHFTLRSNALQASTRVLVLVTGGDLMANTPIDFLLNDVAFSTTFLFITRDDGLPRELPQHDVLITGIAYSSANEPILEALAAAAEHWTQPVINHPRNVIKTSRHGIAAALQGAKGIQTPEVVRTDAARLAAAGYRLPGGLSYPVLIRPLDTHAGNDLQKIDREADLKFYLDRASAETFYLTQFCDYRGSDGLYRKLRVVLIDGVPFLCHMALRDYWMIHYLNAGMGEDAQKREAEAAAMASFDEDFARRHRIAWEEIYRRIGLDYLILDCAESTDGRLLIFEADTGMVIHDMDPADLFPYKAPQMRRVFAAFQRAVRARTA